MVMRMVSREEDGLYTSFEEVLVEIESLLAAYEEKKRQMKARQAQMRAAQSVPPVRRMTLRRLAPAFFLLGLLIVTALVYLNHVDQLTEYTSTIPALWDKLFR